VNNEDDDDNAVTTFNSITASGLTTLTVTDGLNAAANNNFETVINDLDNTAALTSVDATGALGGVDLTVDDLADDAVVDLRNDDDNGNDANDNVDVAFGANVSAENVTFEGGAGDEDIRINGGELDGLTINAGNGGGDITLTGSDGDNVAINGGAGVDNVDLNNGAFDNLAIDTGAGDDGIDLDTSSGNNIEIDAGEGNDTVEGGAGADQIDGGAGTDTISYSGSAQAVIIDLSDNAVEAGGDAQGDKLSNFENVVGSANNDTITGDANANVIEGGAGNETLDGGAGDDTFVFEGDGTDGADTINNFVVGDDAIEFNTSEVVDNGGNVDVDGFALLAGGAATVNDGLVVIDNNDGTNTNAASLGVADVEAYLGDVDGAGGGVSIDADDADDHFYIAVSDGNDTALFEYTGSADTADTAIEDGELDLIVTLDGIGDAGTLSAANFDGFA